MHYPVENTKRLLRSSLAVATLAFLAACGGGGGNTRPVSPPPASVPPPTTDPVVFTPDPDFSKHIALTNTAAAHDAGYTGAGVKIGVLDSGVNRNHPALAGRVVANLIYVNGSDNNLSIDDVVGHGTAVSQIMAGDAFGAWPGGIAPDAQIVSSRIISDDPPEDDGSGQGNEVTGALGLEPIHRDLIDRGVRIMNNSWGGLYWTDPNATDPIADEYRDFIFANDGLVVFSTGNSGFDNPSNTAAIPSQPGPNNTLPAADLEQGWLAVAALDTDNPTQLASYSNACGLAMNYCLVAPGDVVVTGTDDPPDAPEYWSWSGTSFSAPIVSGAAAVVWDAFPYFNNDLVRQTLLGTAKDLGDPGVDAVFGYGLVDVGKAVKGPAQLNWGDVTASFSGPESTWSNDISGAGGIIKRGGGTLVLSGNNSYQGRTQALGGTLRVEGNLTGTSAVTVGAGGTLELANGADLNGDTFNNGTLALLGSDLHTITGNYVQDGAAQLAIEVGTLFDISGTAELNDGELHVLGLAEGYTAQDREIFLSADGGLTGEFGSLTSAPGVFLEATLGYDATDAWLDITRLDVQAAAAAMGFGPTALGSASRVESAFDELDGEPPPGINVQDAQFRTAAGSLQRIDTAAAAERALDSLSGELHQRGTALTLMAIENNRHALERRLDHVQATDTAGSWAQLLDGQRGATPYMDFDSNGWVVGQDMRLDNGVTVGAAFSESRGFGRHEARADRERSRQVEGELYAAWEFGDSYLLGRFALGHVNRDVERQLLLGARAFGVDSRYSQRYGTASVQLGHRLRWDDGVLTPYIGAQALQLQRDGFAEQGAAGFGLTTRDSILTTTQAIAGLRFDHQWQAGTVGWNLHGRAEFQHTLSQTGEQIDARFTGIGAWSPILGSPLGGQASVFGLGIGADFGNGSQLSFDLDSRHGNGRDYAQAQATWEVAF